MLSLEGRQLGNYTVMRRIRSGGMGAVYEGRQRTAFDRRVAIKVILGSYANDADMRRRFAREAKTVARLHHPHILPLIEFGDEQGVLYLVMPFIEGGTLTGYLRRHLPTIHEVSTLFLQLLDAVEYAHDEGLIHRDIKSSNVLLESRRSGPPYAYLADFGLVRTIQQAELESSYAGTPIPLDQVPGTPHYMAPEQTMGIVTPATDIYALGVLLYQMLTGELPYNDPDDIEVIKLHLYAPVPNPHKADASIPAELGTIVEQAMAKRAEERFANVGDFREAFLAAITGPLEPVEDVSFVDEEDRNDFAVYELPPAPAPPERQPRSPRTSQQLYAQPPAPIEFIEPPIPPVRPRRQHAASGDRNEALHPGARERRPQAADQADLHPGPPPRARSLRLHITGEEVELPLPAADARHPRITDDNGEPPHSAIMKKRARTTADAERTLPLAADARRAHFTAEHEEPAHLATEEKRMAVPRQHASPPVRSREAHGGHTARRPSSELKQTRKRSRRLTFAALASIVVPVLLILLLLLPRVFGISLLPAGFPFLGVSPVATISLTLRSVKVHDVFLLTASPQATQEEISAHIIPDRKLTASVNGSHAIATSGLRESGGTQARGTLLFDNSSRVPVHLTAGFAFTASNGVQVQLIGAVTVLPRSNGIDGTATAPARAVEVGLKGNIAPDTLNAPCCGGGVNVRNPAAFSGGTDPNILHVVAQNDIDGVTNELLPGLRQQAQQAFNSQLQPGEIQAGTPTYHTNITIDHPVGSVANQVTVSIQMNASTLVYNAHLATDLAHHLLESEAMQSPGPSYQPRDALAIASPVIEQQGSAGQLYLSISASGNWSYNLSAQIEEQWRQAIRGASVPLAQNYLTTRPGILSVHISLPFGTDHLPTDATQIMFVAS